MKQDSIRRLVEELDDLSQERLHHFDEAKAAENLACAVLQEHPDLLPVVIGAVTNWYEEHHSTGQNIMAIMHTRQAIIEWVRRFGTGGS